MKVTKKFKTRHVTVACRHVGRSILVSINSNALMHDFAARSFLSRAIPSPAAADISQTMPAGPCREGSPYLCRPCHCPRNTTERQKHCGILGHILCTRVLIHRRCRRREIIDTKTLQGHRQKTDRAHHRSASTDPIVHREPGEPHCSFLRTCPNRCPAPVHSHCVLAKLQPPLLESHSASSIPFRVSFVPPDFETTTTVSAPVHHSSSRRRGRSSSPLDLCYRKKRCPFAITT